jgi:hypothetical protein
MDNAIVFELGRFLSFLHGAIKLIAQKEWIKWRNLIKFFLYSEIFVPELQTYNKRTIMKLRCFIILMHDTNKQA